MSAHDRIDELIINLGHDKFKIRQVSMKILETENVQLSRLVAARTVLRDLETRTRIDYLIREQLKGPHPWLPCLPRDYPDREKVLSKYPVDQPNPEEDDRIYCNSDLFEWYQSQYRTATKKFIFDLTIKGTPKADIDLLLLKMQENEHDWKTRSIFLPQPELKW